MKRLPAFILSVCIFSLLITSAAAYAQDLAPVKFPAPQMEGGKPLMEALKDRKTTREFSPRELPPQVLSNLLWAAFGINRPESGRRIAPSAVNWQEIGQNVYLFCASEGLATVVRGLIDKPPLAKAMGLRDSQRIILSQTIGYPK